MVSLNGITIAGFENGGEFCMSELTSTNEDLSVTLLDPSGGGKFGGIMTLNRETSFNKSKVYISKRRLLRR